MKSLTNDQNYNTIVTYQDGEEVHVYASQIVNNGLNYFEGWHCVAGFSRIFILPDTSVFSSECENDFLGKLSDNSFGIFSEPSICRKQTCYNNPDDLMIKKYRFPE